MPRNIELSPRMLLSEREAEVLELMAQGASRTEIMTATRLSAEAVRSHAGRVFRKLDITSMLQAVLWYHELPIIFPRRSGAIKIDGESRPPDNRNSTSYRDILSPGAADVLELLAKGAETDDIARVLHRSQGGVKYYVREILDKLQVEGRAQAALWFHDKPILFSRHSDRYADPEAE